MVVVQPFIIQCLYEAQDIKSCESVFGSLSVVYPEHVFNPYQGITNYDVFSLGYCVSMCNNTWIVNLKLTNIDLDMLGQGMNTVRHGGGYIKNLDLWGSKISIKESDNLLRIPFNILGKIESINLRGCGIDDAGISSLTHRMPHFESLKSLNISYQSVGRRSM